MNNLFVYGCSFTNGGLINEYREKYKLNEDDIIWPEIIAKQMNRKLYNYGEGLFSNDKIFDSILTTFDSINGNGALLP